MKTKQLIEALKLMPQDAEVRYLWDGSSRSDAEMAWLARGGFVVIAERGMVCYGDEDRPTDAALSKDDQYWQAQYDYKKRE